MKAPAIAIASFVRRREGAASSHEILERFGGGGWQAFKFLLAGDNGIIYAVVP
jgi:hypothetical protein